MTLNPSAQVFVPSSQTLRRLKEAPPAVIPEVELSNNLGYSAPQLESLYLDISEAREHEEFYNGQTESVVKSIDYTNFDLPFFFHDMMSADSEDFRNYLSDRAEYLLGYAGTSQKHAIEIVDTILDTVFNLLRSKNGQKYERPLKLAAEMCDMDATFLQMMVQQIIRLVDYLCNPVHQDHAYSLLLGLLLSELHIGTCVAPPETPMGFAEAVCELFLKLLSDKRSFWTGIFAVEQCESQLRSMCKITQIDAICTSLRKLSARYISTELHNKCVGLQKKLRQHTAPLCLKTHAMPVAQLNDEEAQDFEAFLRESRMNFSQCRS